ncbi:hypothetical protein B9Z39_07590 [Limnohabitans sp. JirII-29]|uniref:hypothetical protein n=1 Tax=Limnohabitans sp. JirII-29 TaxID=1835756 RepID=UPI000D399DAD|nr:hypothetical protein [Limnohabitans sp. JirII-29]PUE27617.1 hypothetical protein B9Z39_07590 [Limnohabitans sp. JirII-29]
MATLTRKLNLIALGAVLGLLSFLTGCASSQAKLEAYQKARGDTGFIYAQVNSVHPGISNKETCDKNLGGDKYKDTREKICGRLDELNVVYVSHVVNKEVITSNEIVPVALEIKRGAIIKLDLEKQSPFRFVEVSALEPTENCKWVGSDNQSAYDPITKAGGVALATVAGLMFWPGLVHMSLEQKGGVECNGWSYKTAYKDFLSKY